MGKDIKIKKRPTKDEIVKGKIANALTSAAKNHIVATTDDLYDTNFLEYQDEINKRISTDIEVVKEKAEVLETDVDAVELDVSLLKEHVSDIDESIESVEGEVNTIHGDVNNLHNKVSGIDNRLGSVESNITTINVRVDNAEAELITIKTRMDEINNKIPEEASSSNQLADKQYVLDTSTATAIDLIDGKISPLETRIETVEGELNNLGDFTCGTIGPSTTNFVEGTSYTIHEALQRTANLFEGYQGEIDDINDLIPNQATTQNKLADKAFVNSTVATNAANFRGNWSNWTIVPENQNLYPKDYVGSSTPTNNDYMVIQDASDYVSPEALAHKLTVVNLHATKKFTIGVTTELGEYKEYYYANGFSKTWKSISNEYSLKYKPGNPGIWYIKTNKTEHTHIIKDGVSYSNANDGILLFKLNYSTVPVIIGIPPQEGEYQGSWRFIYVGDWTTNGRLGWKPQYQIGSSFTAEQQAAIDSTITATKVATYDGYGTKITALQTDKLDKNYTANKIYGTDSLGAQTVYTLGDGLGFNNGQIQCTRTNAAWGNITGTLSNQTDLQNALDSKQDILTAGDNIDISNNTISAKGYIFDETKGAFVTKFLKDEYDGGGIGANTASGNYGSFAEGYNNTASGEYGSHAEGFLNTVSGDSAHAEGQENTATHSAAHAEGRKTNATNNGAHSEGYYSDASGLASHVEGWGSKTYHNIASGNGSHTEGVCTRSQNESEHAEGSANVSHKASNTYGDAGNTQHSIGIGTHYNSTKNAVEVMQNGDYYLIGVGGYQGTDTKVQNATIKTLQEVINGKGDAYETATNDDIDSMFVPKN